MAIDTAQKRASSATISAIWNGPSVIPDSSFDQADRQHIAWSYSGILAAAAAIGLVQVTISDAALGALTLADAALGAVTLTDTSLTSQ
jgi:hypothetical protein